MGRITLGILFLIYTTLSWSQACNFQFNQNQVNVNYNGNSVDAFVQLTIQRPNNSDNHPRCANAAVFFGMGQANSYQRKAFKGGQYMSYTLENVSPTGTLKAYGDASGPTEFVLVPIGLNQTKQVDILFRLPSQAVPSGTGLYQDNLNVSLYGFNNMQDVVHVMTKNFIVNVQVQPYMALSIVPTGSAFNGTSTSHVMDFGEIQHNEIMTADLLVSSNNSYRVRVSSANLGNLKHASQNALIPYEFRVNNSVVNLGAGGSIQVAAQSGASAPSGDRYPMQVKMGNPQGKPVGSYSDAITITVSSN